jgi:hypothetical protein
MTIKVEPGLVVPDLRHEDAAAERALASARLAQENQSRLIKSQIFSRVVRMARS